jgi:hypothetical protein
MAYPIPKGSIIFKILIVILAAVLVFVIYFPSKMWKYQVREENECRFRMMALTEVQYRYFLKNKMYADSLEKLQKFLTDNPQEAALLDTIITEVSRLDTTEKNKLSIPVRLYLAVPITLDSIFRCPANGLPYIISRPVPDKYEIICPLAPDTLQIYYVFQKRIQNHGSLNQNKEVSWKSK